VEVLEDAVEPAVGGDELGGGLLPHPGHAGEVVGRVAAQGGVLRVHRRRHPGALEDPGLVVVGVLGDASLDVDDAHVGVLDELVGVAVAGEDEDVVTGLATLGRQGGEDVVGLEAWGLEDRDLQRLEDLADEPHLLAEDVRRRIAGALVGVELLVPEGGLRQVEGHADGVGLPVLQDVHEHRREAEHRVGDLPRRRGEVGGEGEERAVGEGVPVDEQDGALRQGLYESGVRVPAMTSSATARIVRRSCIARFWIHEKASPSL